LRILAILRAAADRPEIPFFSRWYGMAGLSGTLQ